MDSGLKNKILGSFISLRLAVIFVFCLFTSLQAICQNDNCANASPINITAAGYGLGLVNSTTYNISANTVQTGETFAPAILSAGLNQKSMWYKFTLPTTRKVSVTLAQPSTLITAGDAGFTVYRTNNCLPVNADISTKLTPIATFSTTTHPCVEAGDYLIQVSAKNSANGPLYIQLNISDTTGAIYDHPKDAYDFGPLISDYVFVDVPID